MSAPQASAQRSTAGQPGHSLAGREGVGSTAHVAACFATLVFQDVNLTFMNRAWEADEAYVRLWASRMLKVTSLPIYVMHSQVNATAILQPVDPTNRLRYWRVDLIPGGYWARWPHYRYMHTKLEAWRLPCRQVGFLDYDTIPLRNFDNVFDKCGANEPLCATMDIVTPKKHGLKCPNAGMLVILTNLTTNRRLVNEAEREGHEGSKRMLAEQGFLNTHFPNWKELPIGYNLPFYADAWQRLHHNSSYLYHRKIDEISMHAALVAGVARERDAIHKKDLRCKKDLRSNTTVTTVFGTFGERVCGGARLERDPYPHIIMPPVSAYLL